LIPGLLAPGVRLLGYVTVRPLGVLDEPSVQLLTLGGRGRERTRTLGAGSRTLTVDGDGTSAARQHSNIWATMTSRLPLDAEP
jgi:hypothetical protein